MAASAKTAITPTREENYPSWYQEVISASELAEHSVTRGSMVIRPYGFAIWENIQQELDKRIKAKGHQNAYFPLLIPLNLLQKEAEHVDGFAKECAVVTHHRLEADQQGKLQPAGKLEEPYVIRPTSEMIIGECFSRWVQSYRDLPLKINQWANVMRWEMRTRLFLRTSEFLWQEGHTAHETKEQAYNHSLDMLSVYQDFCHNHLALPVIKGTKPEHEKFPGAIDTFCIESLMQDNKALQAGTSHFMGQNFSKSCNIEFSDKDGKRQHAWTTSWGVTTRLIGALIMTHSDDQGLVLPPKIAPYQVVIQPIVRKNANENEIFEYCQKIYDNLTSQGVRVHFDKQARSAWYWIKKGVPVRVEIGSKEVEKDSLSYFIRHNDQHKTRLVSSCQEFYQNCSYILKTIGDQLLEQATLRQEKSFSTAHNIEELENIFSTESHPGFVKTYLHYCEDSKKILDKLKATVRYIPLESNLEEAHGTCIITGKENCELVVLARAY